MSCVQQFIPVLAPRDAASSHARQIRRALDEWGIDGRIWAERGMGDLASAVGDHRHYRSAARPDDVLLYHFAVGSVVADGLLARPETLLVDHHNLTPASFFLPWDADLVHAVTWGQRQLAELAGRATAASAVSRFNEGDLVAAGFGVTGVVPILLDTGGFERGVDAGLVDRLRSEGGSRWLFVGRLAPNKCQHDVVKAFSVFRRLYDPGARLDLVGGVTSPAYGRAVEGLVGALGLGDVVRMVGSVSDEELGAFYSAADVLVCLSEHEGFCVPLVEAMWHGVAVVAFGSSAVPETVGSGGLVLGSKAPGVVAAAVARVVGDPVVREGLVAAGRARVGELSLERSRAALRHFLAPYVAGLA